MVARLLNLKLYRLLGDWDVIESAWKQFGARACMQILPHRPAPVQEAARVLDGLLLGHFHPGKSSKQRPPPLLATGMEMLTGGALLLIFSLLRGEPQHFDAHAVSTASMLGVLYLTTFGSLIGFTAFIFLLNHVPAARVATYAYVNPVVAVFLGWLIGHESITARTLIAAVVIIGAVALITTARSEPEPAAN